MTFRIFDREGLKLRYRDLGDGPCVPFQHGLGGTESQVADIFPAELQVRRLTLECRGRAVLNFIRKRPCQPQPSRTISSRS